MTKQFKQTIILSAIVLLISCGKSEREIKAQEEKVAEQEKKRLREQLKTQDEKAVFDLNHKYNSISGWDSLKTYTYVFQEMFIDDNEPISFEGQLMDITKSDSAYFIQVHHKGQHYNSKYIAQISVTSDRFAELEDLIYNRSNKGCFIFKVSKIVSISPEIASDSELDGEDSYSYLTYEFDEPLLIFKGDLIDFYLNETVEKK